MKFLGKSPDSQILKDGLCYLENRGIDNAKLRSALLAEQKNFCAYTEMYCTELESVEVEHFNQSLKYQDDYYNYYAVIRWANTGKPDGAFKGKAFFTSLFFQNREIWNSRIRFIDNTYETTDENDQEASDLILFLRLNHPDLFNRRKKRVERISKTLLGDARYQNNPIRIIEYFRDHPEELSFITALEIELNLDLSEFWKYA